MISMEANTDTYGMKGQEAGELDRNRVFFAGHDESDFLQNASYMMVMMRVMSAKCLLHDDDDDSDVLQNACYMIQKYR